MTRAEKAGFHYDLIEFLTNCENDKEFFERLTYALLIISAELAQFEKNA